MSAEQRQPSSATGKPKRRRIDPEEDGKVTGELKRHRVSRACDSCRTKKDKCDGLQPICSTCASIGRPCTYKANPKKRGLPTGYIRSLELLWGLVFQRIRGSEDVVRALMRSINLPGRLATTGKEAEGSDTLMASFKNSAVLRDIERILVVLEQPEDERERSLQAFAEGESSLDIEGISASASAREWQLPEGVVAHETPCSGASPPRIEGGISPMTYSGPRETRDCGVQTATPSQSPSLSLTLPPASNGNRSPLPRTPLRLPDNAWPLFDVYFSYTQCWFPILEKHDILRTAFQYTEGDVYTSSLTPGSGDHAALWAVLALASLQNACISVTQPVDEQSRTRMTPSQMYMTARQLIPSESGPHDIGHVQALLILALVKFGQQDSTGSWMLVGQAVRIAHILGVEKLSSSPQAKTTDHGKQLGRAKHVFLGCFVLETLIAESTSRCPSLRKADLAKVGPVNEDGLEEWHPWEDQTGLRPVQASRASMHRGPLHALSTFNHLVSLISILNELCCCKHDLTVSRSQLEQMELQLQRWAVAIPKAYRVDLQNRPMKVASPHIFGLEMVYESVVIALSSHIAIREHDQNLQESPHKFRAVESTRRLLQLLEVYMETYSFPATAPIFGVILRFGLPQFASADVVSELEVGMRHKIFNISTRLCSLWAISDRQSAGQNMTQRSPPLGNSPMLSDHVHASTSRGAGMPSATSTDTTSHRLPPTQTSHHSGNPARSPIEALFSTPWPRNTPHINDLPLIPTSLNLSSVDGSSEMSSQRGLLPNSLAGVHPHRTSATSGPHSDTGFITGFSPSYNNTPRYHTTYQDQSLHIGPLVDESGYAPRRQRIAPDLDALFDELASLDGAEKIENQPEFMQNLGFVSDVGMPELYSFAGQIEPFFLTQSQQLPNNGPSSGQRQERPS